MSREDVRFMTSHIHEIAPSHNVHVQENFHSDKMTNLVTGVTTNY